MLLVAMRKKHYNLVMKQFIVPFYGFIENIDEKSFIGSAFLVQPNLLITAGHNVQGDLGRKFKNFCIIFQNKTVKLGKHIYIDYNYKLIHKDNTIQDLAIWNLSTIICPSSMKNAFQLGDFAEIDVSTHYIVYGYDIETGNGLKEVIPYYVNIKNAKTSITEIAKNTYLSIYNCFETIEQISSGFSGSPLYQENLVYGMVIGSLGIVNRDKTIKNNGTRLLKSSYIIDIIDKIDSF